LNRYAANANRSWWMLIVRSIMYSSPIAVSSRGGGLYGRQYH
jgi:hypothetical protein